MFRASAAGPYDEAIAKSTDENLTSEDWGAIIEVCDRVSGDQNGPKEVVQSLIKRLAHRNANVQLYTLELANALSQNCGKNMHRELSSRAFTDSLLKLANDRNTHTQVKSRILERMAEWSEMFKSDSDLGVMYDAYYRLKLNNPTLQPPSAPQKNSLTDTDRQKEDEELQMALKLSLQEEERKKKAAEPGPSSSGPGQANAASTSSQPAAPLQPAPTGTTAATVSRVRALYDFVPSEPGELEFRKGDVIAVLESVYRDWWRGSLKGKTGIFPLNYVEKLTDPTPDELQREAQMEAEVFAEIKNVEKLLTLLSATNTAPKEEDNEEISKLYHQTLAIRPKLIKLIEKYSQKKDDFTQLNEKFIKARRDHEALLESSMSHPPGPSYHQYAMRPQIPHPYHPSTGAPGFPSQPIQQQQQQPQQPPQDHQGYYTPAPAPGPVQEQPQYPPSSPSPNFHRPNGNPTPAPFYMAGAEVPAQGGPPPGPTHQPQPQRQPPQQQSQPQPQPQQQPMQQPPLQPEQPHHPSAGRQPAPIKTSISPPPPSAPYVPYQPGARPQNTYAGATGVPQELSTSVYDSPIAPKDPNSAATYSSSVYSGDGFESSPGAADLPSAPPDQRQDNSYQPYTVYHNLPAQPSYPGYDASGGDASRPPPPTGQAPPPPVPQAAPDSRLTPPPLHPGGAAYDARQGLPSRANVGSPPAGQPQYRAYVPPGMGGSSNDGPTAPTDYYRTAAY